MKVPIATLQFEDMHEGDKFVLEEVLTEKMVTDFANLSGDWSTLHLNDGFARRRGFRGRVVHGLLLANFFSKLVGMYFPGENALLLSVNVNFHAPAYIGDPIKIIAHVDQISTATNVIVLKASIENKTTHEQLVSGKIRVSFTHE
jgi:acyl dehydratase